MSKAPDIIEILLQSGLQFLIDIMMTKYSFFAVVGLTGAGKSSLINALSNNKNLCEVSDEGESKTQKLQDYHFSIGENKFSVIDTAGLDDKDETKNKEKIDDLSKLLGKYPKIKKILIVKKFDDYRLTKSIIDSLIVFMKSFPLKNFWKHVIVINTFSEKESPIYKKKIKTHQKFINKILKENNLIDFMKKNNIDIPTDIKEYFVESYGYFELPEIYSGEREIFDEILKDIKESDMMYKSVFRSGELHKVIDSKKHKGFHIIKRYQTVTCYDYNDKKYEIEINLGEEEKAPVPPFRSETIQELESTDSVKWYDILTLGISYLIRDTKYYKEYKINYYKINGEEIQGEKIFVRTLWK